MKTSTRVLNMFLLIVMYFLTVFCVEGYFETGEYFYLFVSLCAIVVLFLHGEWYVEYLIESASKNTNGKVER